MPAISNKRSDFHIEKIACYKTTNSLIGSLPTLQPLTHQQVYNWPTDKSSTNPPITNPLTHQPYWNWHTNPPTILEPTHWLPNSNPQRGSPPTHWPPTHRPETKWNTQNILTQDMYNLYTILILVTITFCVCY